MVVLDPGATADFVCFSWLARHARFLGKNGIPRVTTYPSKARFRFSERPLGEVRHPADIPVGAAGKKGKFTALVLDAGIPALLRRGDMEALGGQLGFLRVSSVLRRQGANFALRVNRAGHYILSAVDFRKDPSRSLPCPEAPTSFFHIVQKAPDPYYGGLHFPYAQEGLYRFEPPPTFAASKPVTLQGAEN